MVDTGIHALGWTRQQNIDYMAERTGVDREFFTLEIDRYTSDPGQALAYMTGQLKITELRYRVRTRLGARFNIRRFHNAVLDQGALPLATLEHVIDAWIEAQLKGSGDFSAGVPHLELSQHGLLALQEVAQRMSQSTQVGFDHAPHNAVIHIGIAVDQQIAKGDNARQLRDQRCGIRITAPQGTQRLADDFELPFDSAA